MIESTSKEGSETVLTSFLHSWFKFSIFQNIVYSGVRIESIQLQMPVLIEIKNA